MSIDSGDIKWLAGLLEGEGCFGYYATGLRIGLAMSDKDVVERAARLMRPTGARHDNPPKLDATHSYINHHGKKQMFRFTVSGARAAEWMMTLFPVMGERRKSKIRASLQKWQASGIGRKYEPFCRKGHQWDGPRGRGYRCSTCVRERSEAYNLVYRQTHADKIAIYRHDYYLVNREQILARHRAYAIANREKTLARQREWYLKNRERLIARARIYRIAKRVAPGSHTMPLFAGAQ